MMDNVEKSGSHNTASSRGSSKFKVGSRDVGLSDDQAAQSTRRYVQTQSRIASMQSLSPYKRTAPYTEYPNVRRLMRHGDKSKGLRHFSTKVCEKVKEKGTTNYNEVADELVAEYFNSTDIPPGDSQQQYDMKNIRRRVYDALNVLMAMNIIEKEKKEIRWVGLPTSSIQECRKLEQEKAEREDIIRRKSEQLHELIIQLISYKSLVERNREEERKSGRPSESSILYLPFIVVNTDKQTMVDCAISHDKTEYLFNFNQPFEIHDDIEILKRLGFAHGLEQKMVEGDKRQKIKSYLPPILREYIDQICAHSEESPTEPEVSVTCFSTALEDNKADCSSIVSHISGRQSVSSQSYDGQQLSASKQSPHFLQRNVAFSGGSQHMYSPVTSGSNRRQVTSSSVLPRQYSTQPRGDMVLRGYSRQTEYSIQLPNEERGEQYDEVYDDCEENLTYE